MLKKNCLLLLCLLLGLVGCEKVNQSLPKTIYTATLHISVDSEFKTIPLSVSEVNFFVKWLEDNQPSKMSLRRLPLSPDWCFVFNEYSARKLMSFCYYHQIQGISLQQRAIKDKVDFYQVTDEDKRFFKAHYNALSTLSF